MHIVFSSLQYFRKFEGRSATHSPVMAYFVFEFCEAS